MDTGKQIRKYRKSKNLTMKQLGEVVGVSEQAISQYELGKRNPDIEILNKIAIVLGVPINTLTGTKKTFTQEILEELLNKGNTLDMISKDTNIPLEDLNNMLNNSTASTMGNIKKLCNYINATDEEFLNLILSDTYINAMYNNDDTDNNLKQIRDLFLKEPLSLTDDMLIKNTNNNLENIPFYNESSSKNDLNNIIYTKDLCYKLGISNEKIGTLVDLNSILSIKQLQLICTYLKLEHEEEAFLYSNIIYKTENRIFRIVEFYRYLRDEYGTELFNINDDYLDIGYKISEKFNLFINIGYAVNPDNKKHVADIITNEDKYKKTIEDMLNITDKTEFTFLLDDLSLEDCYNIFYALSETLDFELYTLNRKYTKVY